MICDAKTTDPDLQELNRHAVVLVDDTPVTDLVEYVDTAAGEVRIIRRDGEVIARLDSGQAARATLNGVVRVALKASAPDPVKTRYEAACQADGHEPLYW